MLVHKDEGVKLEAGTEKEKEKEKEEEVEEKEKDKDKETNSLLVSIFQNIKCSEDVVDREKSKVGEKCLSLYLVFTLCIIMWLKQKTLSMRKYKNQLEVQQKQNADLILVNFNICRIHMLSLNLGCQSSSAWFKRRMKACFHQFLCL